MVPECWEPQHVDVIHRTQFQTADRTKSINHSTPRFDASNQSDNGSEFNLDFVFKVEKVPIVRLMIFGAVQVEQADDIDGFHCTHPVRRGKLPAIVHLLQNIALVLRIQSKFLLRWKWRPSIQIYQFAVVVRGLSIFVNGNV